MVPTFTATVTGSSNTTVFWCVNSTSGANPVRRSRRATAENRKMENRGEELDARTDLFSFGAGLYGWEAAV